jgi:hypothetical protein
MMMIGRGKLKIPLSKSDMPVAPPSINYWEAKSFKPEPAEKMPRMINTALLAFATYLAWFGRSV